MTNSQLSNLEDIHDAISNYNPFTIKFVDQHHVWGESFPDVVAINAHVSDAVFDAIKQVSTGQIPSIGVTITGEKGLGKTQVISRIRHRIQQEGKSFFIYMGNYGDLNYIKPEFIQTVASSLKKIGSQEVMQWQELAANILFEVRGDRPCTARELVEERFIRVLANNPKVVETWTNTICQKKPSISNPYLIKAILWTLSKNHAPYAINWLSGQELAQSKADELGLPNLSGQRKEIESFNTTCEILDLISNYSTLVFCFDELDDPSCNDGGYTRAQVVGALAKDLRNRIHRCVLLMAMLPVVFRDQIKLVPQSGASFDRTADKVLELDYLNADSSFALISTRLEEFYKERDLTPPFPFYPFDEAVLREIANEKPTARTLLKWCADNFKTPGSGGGTGDLPKSTLEIFHENELTVVEAGIKDYIEDKEIIAKAIYIGFRALIGQTIDNVQIMNVEESNSKYVDFKIVAKEINVEGRNKNIKIGVAVVQQAGGVSVTAALKQLTEYESLDINRGCLVRSKSISSNATQAFEYLRTLLINKKGEWVMLQEDDIKPLIASWFIVSKKEQYEIGVNEIIDFIKSKKIAINNPLIREILSKPEGKIPRNIANEDLPISIPITPHSSSDNTIYDTLLS